MILLVAVAFGLQSAFAARLYPSKGRRLEWQGQPIQSPTLVLLSNRDALSAVAIAPHRRSSLTVLTGHSNLHHHVRHHPRLTQRHEAHTLTA